MYNNTNQQIDWAKRFSLQLSWTYSLRTYLYKKYLLNATQGKRLLDIGCGTGNLLLELGKRFDLSLYGIDMDETCFKDAYNLLNEAKIPARLYKMDASKTAFETDFFDYIISHLFFLWVDNPFQTLRELRRILKPGGVLFILCEPDYGAFIEYPETGFTKAITTYLTQIGADIHIARKLPSYFTHTISEDSALRQSSLYSRSPCKKTQKKKLFSLIEKLTISMPYLASEPHSKKALLREVEFYSKILGSSFNPTHVLTAIKKENYFFYNPLFCFVLRKT